MKFGLYRLSDLLDDSVLTCLEKKYGTEVSIISFYRAWNYCSIEDDLPWLTDIFSSSRDIMLTWEPWRIPPDPTNPEDQPGFSLNNISSGMYDFYIKSFAASLASFPKTIYLRPMHEMNGFWYPWCGTTNHNNPKEYLRAWKHLRRLFAEEGSSNVKWVWSPYASSHPASKENSICSYFPGDDEIDLIAIDGYNWGESTKWGTWQSFLEIFKDAYDTITSISEKPIIIAETGCTELGGSKSEWISEMFSILPSRFERIQAIVWFDINKECDWRISSSESSQHSFRQAVRLTA